MKAHVHIVDDEARLGEILAMVLGRDGHQTKAWTDPVAFLAALESGAPCDVVLTDLKMQEKDGLEVLSAVKAHDDGIPVILITAHATVQTAIAALQAGAFDYVEKPFDNDDCRALVARAVSMTQLARENRYLRAQLAGAFDPAAIVAESDAMRATLDLAARAAKSDRPVLVLGETGSGKELVARAIHFASPRVGGPFVAVNVGAFAPGVVESELFGHDKGAFTGADRARKGVFERATGGTLFLDEIGELAPDVQAKLLRVLQEGEVVPVGAEAPRSVDVRVVSATWRDLEQAVADGSFRQDLYYRLAVIPVELAPLRDRTDDVLPLARRFLARAAAELDRPTLALSDAASAALLAHSWPGNVRELENAIERAAILSRDDVIEAEDLRLSRPSPPIAGDEGGGEDADVDDQTLSEALDRAAVRRIRRALAASDGKKASAASALGIERTTLYRLMKKYDLD